MFCFFCYILLRCIGHWSIWLYSLYGQMDTCFTHYTFFFSLFNHLYPLYRPYTCVKRPTWTPHCYEWATTNRSWVELSWVGVHWVSKADGHYSRVCSLSYHSSFCDALQCKTDEKDCSSICISVLVSSDADKLSYVKLEKFNIEFRRTTLKTGNIVRSACVNLIASPRIYR